MNVYIISGLGVDKRVFTKLQFSPNNSVHYLEWIKPLPRESIFSYAKRMTDGIDISKPFSLIGLSFGGMMAVEISKIVTPTKTILISSAASSSELPWFIKIFRFFPLYKILPSRLLRTPNHLLHYYFDINTTEEKALLKTILKDSDPEIISWSIDQVVNWENKIIPENLVHLHGDRDRLLPAKPRGRYQLVKGGGHFMVYSKAKEISEMIDKILPQSQL